MRAGFFRTPLLVMLVAAAILVYLPGSGSGPFTAQAQSAPNRTPMTLSGLVDALKKGMGVLPVSEFVQTIQRRGVSFELTASAERQLQQAGATSAILQAVRANYRGVSAASRPAPAPAAPVSPALPPAPGPAAVFDQARSLYDATRFGEAAPLFLSACDGGIPAACIYLGFMYENGTGVSPDNTQAVVFFRKACDGGYANGCSNLGFMYENGKGVTPDNTQAVVFFRKACDGGFAHGCFNLGVMYENGKGVTTDKTQAVALYRKTCDAGEPNGCNNLGVMYEAGTGVSPDKTQAVTLYRKACDAGTADGCTNLKRLQP